MTCEQFEIALPAYLAGTLAEHEARLLEEHAAACAACEQRLDAATRLDRQLDAYVASFRDAPPSLANASSSADLPEGLRAATLAAVARRRQQQQANRWLRSVTALAAVALLAVAVREFASRSSATRGSDTAVAATNPVASPTTTMPATARPDSTRTDTAGARARIPAPAVAVMPSTTPPAASSATSGVSTPAATSVSRVLVSNPDRFAEERSSTEFAALDVAARELEAALARSPDDAELRAFLATVQARRDELTRRVKAARS